MSNCTNHEFYFMDNGCMPLRNKSMTLMRFCGFPHHGYRFFAGAQNDALPSSSLRQQILHIRFGWCLNVLYKDHGAGRHKELPAHAVRLMIPACRNDLIVKEYLACSRQLTADSFYLLTGFLTTVTDSSLPLRMTSYGFPHHGSKSFTFASDDD